MTRQPRRFAHATAVLAFSALALALSLALVAAPETVEARCVEPRPIEEAIRTADVVIVGTVTAVAQEGTHATVAVDEIWRGPKTPAIVLVRGGPAEGRSSVDRTFEVGTRYLFTLGLEPDGQLTDSACSSTTEWDAKLGALRPPGAHLPGAAGELDAAAAAEPTFDPLTLVVPAGVALLVATALLIAGLLARGRKTNR
jgi:hypothetical protein